MTPSMASVELTDDTVDIFVYLQTIMAGRYGNNVNCRACCWITVCCCSRVLLSQLCGPKSPPSPNSLIADYTTFYRQSSQTV